MNLLLAVPVVMLSMSDLKTRRTNLGHITAKLAALQSQHEAGESVYAEMAARISERAELPQIKTDDDVSQDETLWEEESQ